MTATTMHFSIDGAWLTGLVRNLWAERNAEKALGILKSAFPQMDEEVYLSILTGKKKLVGINNCQLKKDNATEDDRGLPLPSINDYIKHQREALEKKSSEAMLMADFASGDFVTMPSPWGMIKVPRSRAVWHHSVDGSRYILAGVTNQADQDAAWDAFEAEFPGLVEDAEKETNERNISRIQNANAARLGIGKRKVDGVWQDIASDLGGGTVDGSILFDDPRLQAAYKAITDEDNTVPEPDGKLVGLNGWISPEGEFYSCGFMGHVGLAARLNNTEGKLEDSWVKVQDTKDPMAIIPRSGSDFMHIPEDGVTQKQYDTMWEWATKHKRKFPKDTKIRD